MTEETIPIYQIDAFTAEPFKGNPAAVCLADQPLNTRTLQAIAAEMNLSETAFVHPLDGRPWREAETFSLRWFTPTVEVRLCGHGTLAAAAALFREVGVKTDTVRFETRSGSLFARQKEAGIALDFPADPTNERQAPEGLYDALGLNAEDGVAVRYAPRTQNLLVHLTDAALVHDLAPDMQTLSEVVNAANVHGPIVTARGHAPYDVVSRYFAPAIGIPEDPVTGSAHTVLAPYWAKILEQEVLFAYQASKRGGELHVRLLERGRVEIIGEAVTVVKGQLYL